MSSAEMRAQLSAFTSQLQSPPQPTSSRLLNASTYIPQPGFTTTKLDVHRLAPHWLITALNCVKSLRERLRVQRDKVKVIRFLSVMSFHCNQLINFYNILVAK